jgi:hypothetical protein
MRLLEVQIAYVMMNESILLEDRIDYMIQNTPKLDTSHDITAEHKDTPSIIRHLADKGDPSRNKVYTAYLVNLYKNKSIRQDDTPHAHETLSNFDKHKHMLPVGDRNISAKLYPTLSSIADKVAPFAGKLASKKEGKRNLEQPGHELKYEDDKIKIYHLTGKDASQNLYGGGSERGGMGTNWCTAARSDDCRFDSYRKEGEMRVVHRKSDGAVFQYHVPKDESRSGEFQDAKNNAISHEDFGTIADSLHKAWEKHPELAK